jgi:hypothetical protein
VFLREEDVLFNQEWFKFEFLNHLPTGKKDLFLSLYSAKQEAKVSSDSVSEFEDVLT